MKAAGDGSGLRRPLKTDVVVIGGGATGAGVARDLALRGLKVILVERRDLAAGATGRCHGLLHSGVRYSVKDLPAAMECILENRVLKEVAPQAIEDTGGFMVFLKGDDPRYLERWLANTQQAGIGCEEIPPGRALELEPNLSLDAERVFSVPDASVDPFQLTLENVRSAARRGATVLRHAPVAGIRVHSGRVHSVEVLQKGEILSIGCEMAVIAAGAWSDEVARLAGVRVPLNLSKGSLVILNHRVSRRVLNRCRMPSDADLVIPNGSTSIVGTTSIQASSPDAATVTPEEVEILLAETREMIPALDRCRPIRGYAGIRPLYQDPSHRGDARDLTRGFFVLDHESRDGLRGLATVVGGKLTTFRLMAEKTADLVCEKLGIRSRCLTREEPLFDSAKRRFFVPGEKIRNILKGQKGWDPVICECELVSRNEILKASFEIGQEVNLADIQHRTRMGMGTCQGGFCSLRTAGILAGTRDVPFDELDQGLRSFLNERWKGIYPLLWGHQLREEHLNYGIYAGLFNLDMTRSS